MGLLSMIIGALIKEKINTASLNILIISRFCLKKSLRKKSLKTKLRIKIRTHLRMKESQEQEPKLCHGNQIKSA